MRLKSEHCLLMVAFAVSSLTAAPMTVSQEPPVAASRDQTDKSDRVEIRRLGASGAQASQPPESQTSAETRQPETKQPETKASNEQAPEPTKTPTADIPPSRPNIRREWEGFAPGSSARIQRKRIVYDEEGQIESTTTIKTMSTLVSRKEGLHTLRMQLEIDVAGQVFEPPPNTVHYGQVSEKPGEKVTSEHLGAEKLEIDHEEFPCQKYQVTIESDAGRRITRLWLSEVYPYVLKSEAVLTANNSESAERISAHVIAMDMPFEVLSEFKSGVLVHIVSEKDAIRSVTIEATCPDVPGGIIWHTKKILVDGQLQEESHLRLIEYRSERAENSPPQPQLRRILLPRRKRLHDR